MKPLLDLKIPDSFVRYFFAEKEERQAGLSFLNIRTFIRKGLNNDRKIGHNRKNLTLERK
jgi:hypothetical protein